MNVAHTETLYDLFLLRMGRRKVPPTLVLGNRTYLLSLRFRSREIRSENRFLFVLTDDTRSYQVSVVPGLRHPTGSSR